MAAMAAEAKQAQAAIGKPLKEEFLQKRLDNMQSSMSGLQNAENIMEIMSRGGEINPITSSGFITKLSTLVNKGDARHNVSAAEVRRQIELFARRIARSSGADVGNFAISEAKAFIAAIEGNNWDTAPTAFRNMLQSLRENQQARMQSMKALTDSGYNAQPLVPYYEEIEQRLQGLERFWESDKKKPRKTSVWKR